MTRYFLFMVINGFLIVTLSSGLIAAIPEITKNPSSAVTLLATRLPSASTFFLTYFVTVSFSGAAGALLQIARLILYYVKLVLLGSTPRSVWNLKDSFASVAWGTLVSRFGSRAIAQCGIACSSISFTSQYPSMTLLTVIGLTYSIIAPLICGFACIAFAMFWFVYKVSRCFSSTGFEFALSFIESCSTFSCSSSRRSRRPRPEASSTRRRSPRSLSASTSNNSASAACSSSLERTASSPRFRRERSWSS